jgi:site-specific DNA-methyltransferase (adenine-specific)
VRRNRLICGDALEVLRTLPDASIDTCITSPPYYGVRDYGAPGQFGQETSIEGWVEHLRLVAAELARVLVPWGAFWLNIADTYSRTPGEGAPAKSLLLGPERLARALLADGWIVRNRIAWAKTNPLPSPAADRLTPAWEHLFFLTRIPRGYFFDLDAIREPPKRKKTPPREVGSRRLSGNRDHGHSGLQRMQRSGRSSHPLGKNPGDWWQIGGSRSPHHPATFPAELIRRPILATCPEKVCQKCNKPWERSRQSVWVVRGIAQPRPLVPCGCAAPTRPGLVLDPFLGSGTTAAVAEALGRDWLGIELSPAYVRVAERRLKPRGWPTGRRKGTRPSADRPSHRRRTEVT